MGLRAEQSERLVAVFALGCLLLTYPLLTLFNRAGSVFGIPLLYAYLFAAWALTIVLMALAVKGSGAERAGGAAGTSPVG